MIQKIVQKDISSLIFAEYNPSQLSKTSYLDIKKSIQKFGIIDPIIINKHKDRKGVIIGGHQRVRVAKDLKFDKVPCVELNLPVDEEKELNVRLNKNTGSFDFDVLADMFDMDDLIDWGFAESELVGYEAEPPKPKNPDMCKLTFELEEEVYLLWIQWVTRAGLMTGDKSDEVAFQLALTEALKISEEFVN